MLFLILSSYLILSAIREDKVITVSDEVLWRKDGGSFPVEYICTRFMIMVR